jgi:uncharacterized protein (TIGR02246 family)
MGGPPTDKENADMGDTETSTRVHEVGIDRLRDRHVAALNAGDADAWVDCFTDDGVQMPPHFATNAGKSAVRGWSQGFLNLFDCWFSLSVDEVRVAADWAFERGRYTITLTPKAGGGPVDDSGKYITVYQRQSDGSWKIARDIWNSDQPLPGTR